MRAWLSRMALKTAWKQVLPCAVLLLSGTLTLSALADEHTDEERPITRRPLPFVSFLEKSLMRIPAIRDITVGDFNADGFPDLIFHTSDSGVLWTSLGNAEGNFGLP